MSRYYIPSKDERYEVTVGWDTPMNTYFGQVIDRKDETDTPIHWVGTRHDEIQSTKQLQEGIAAYATIPEGTLKNLAADRAHSRQPSRFQRETREWFSEGRTDPKKPDRSPSR